MKNYRYRLLENGVVFYEGSRQEVCRKLQKSKTTDLYDYAIKKRKISNRYDVVVLLEEKEKDRREREILENQIFHLTHKEKTVAMDDLKRNIELLKEKGIAVRTIEAYGESDKDCKQKIEKYYILEAI